MKHCRQSHIHNANDFFESNPEIDRRNSSDLQRGDHVGPDLIGCLDKYIYRYSSLRMVRLYGNPVWTFEPVSQPGPSYPRSSHLVRIRFCIWKLRSFMER